MAKAEINNKETINLTPKYFILNIMVSMLFGSLLTLIGSIIAVMIFIFVMYNT